MGKQNNDIPSLLLKFPRSVPLYSSMCWSEVNCFLIANEAAEPRGEADEAAES